MTHAEQLAAAERAVVDAAVVMRQRVLDDGKAMEAAGKDGRLEAWRQGTQVRYTNHDRMDATTDALLALRASTCPECLGDGRKHTYDANGQPQPWIEDHGVCPACSGTGERK